MTVLMEGVTFGESPRWHDWGLWFSDWGTNEIVAGWPTFDIEDEAPLSEAMRLREPLLIDTAEGRLTARSLPEQKMRDGRPVQVLEISGPQLDRGFHRSQWPDAATGRAAAGACNQLHRHRQDEGSRFRSRRGGAGRPQQRASMVGSRRRATASGDANCSPVTLATNRPPRMSPRASSRRSTRTSSRHGGSHGASRCRMRQATTP